MHITWFELLIFCNINCINALKKGILKHKPYFNVMIKSKQCLCCVLIYNTNCCVENISGHLKQWNVNNVKTW